MAIIDLSIQDALRDHRTNVLIKEQHEASLVKPANGRPVEPPYEIDESLFFTDNPYPGHWYAYRKGDELNGPDYKRRGTGSSEDEAIEDLKFQECEAGECECDCVSCSSGINYGNTDCLCVTNEDECDGECDPRGCETCFDRAIDAADQAMDAERDDAMFSGK